MIKVFIVDDEPLVRRGIISMLPVEQFGMELVGQASSGEEALLTLESCEIDLLFTDISMPGMDGLQLIQTVNNKYPRIRSVVLTCHQEFDYLQQALRLGAIDYIVKTQLDDDSVVDLLRRVSQQFDMNGMNAGREEQQKNTDGDVFSQGEQWLETWCKLKWLVEEEYYNAILASFMHSFTLREWKNILYQAHQEWIVKCPSLEPLNSMAAELSLKETVSELISWVKSVHREAWSLMRNTMYSEEVIQSIIRAVDLLHEHAGEKMNQADICKLINMSISYFSKSFKEIVGIPFVTYVQEMNIRLAQHLLQTTNYPIYQIAEQSGFQDEKYFGKIFRMKSGFSPSEYRMQFRGNL